MKKISILFIFREKNGVLGLILKGKFPFLASFFFLYGEEILYFLCEREFNSQAV